MGNPFQNSKVGNVVPPNAVSSVSQNYPALAANLAEHNLSQFGQIAASAAQKPPIFGQTVASATQMPMNSSPMAASATQMLPNFGQTTASAVQTPYNFGQMDAIASQMPQTNANLSYTQAQMDASASQLAQLLSNPLISQMFNTVQMQFRSNKPVLPWEAAAKLHSPFVQDPSMPRVTSASP